MDHSETAAPAAPAERDGGTVTTTAHVDVEIVNLERTARVCMKCGQPFTAVAVIYPNHRYWRIFDRPTCGGSAGYVGSVYHCGWCGSELSGRRTAWCSDQCSNRFYRVWSWGAVANYVIQRDGEQCRRCGTKEPGHSRHGRQSGWQVDHIVPVKDGGTDDPENLRTLCHDCHVAVGYEQRRARKAKSNPELPLAS